MHQSQEEHQKSLRQMSSDQQSLHKAMIHQAALHPDRQSGRASSALLTVSMFLIGVAIGAGFVYSAGTWSSRSAGDGMEAAL